MSVTLAVMARAPLEGRCKTRLAASLGAAWATRLYEAMLLDTLERLGRLPADRHVVLAAPEDEGVARLKALVPAPWQVVAQEGEGLGERLRNGVRVLWEEGGAVALVSSDSPTVPTVGLVDQLRAIAGQRRAVFGPSHDGGYYLVGLGSLDADVFEGIPWSSSHTLKATLARCAVLSVPVVLLPLGHDVDEAEDLERMQAELSVDASLAPRCREVLRTLSPRTDAR